ncbi:unnamed protein product, partial [Ceratitis capitata]
MYALVVAIVQSSTLLLHQVDQLVKALKPPWRGSARLSADTDAKTAEREEEK